MEQALLDTDILSYFLRGDHTVYQNVRNYLNIYSDLAISIITYYEIKSGLSYRDSSNQLDSFNQFCELNNILPFTQKAADQAAKWYAQLRKTGDLIDDIDLLIASIAITNELVLVTHNKRHFERIPDLKVQDWSLSVIAD